MTKIMLVEDDKSLREIYGVRLLAEGYDIVSAGDGEEALAMAIKERPQLIISDVMMPKVSGYDMLDILRSTTETRNTRVIMMTALSSDEQRQRAESLGADRYLVKSQVGIEDVVRVVHEVLEDIPTSTTLNTPVVNTVPPAAVAPMATVPAAAPVFTPVPAPQAAPEAPVAVPAFNPVPVTPLTPAPAVAPAPAAFPAPAPRPFGMPTPAAAPVAAAPKPASLKTRIIQPLNDPSVAPVNINDLLDKELAKEAGIVENQRPVVESISQERAEVEAQLSSFAPVNPEPVAAPTPPAPVAVPEASPVLPTPGISAANPIATPTPAVVAVPVPPLPPVPPTVPMTPVQPVAVPQPAMPTAPVPTASTLPVPSTVPVAPSAPTQPLASPAITTATGPSPVQQLPNVPQV